MSAVREMYDVEDVVGGAMAQPWPRLVREVAPVYGQDASEKPSLSDHAGAAPDPDDELFTLGERCAEAYMQADALQYQAMRLLVEFHHREGWRDTGFSSTAEWLAWRIGIQPGAARERLRTALALEDLPQISQAMEEGALSFTKVRALTRVATPDSESTLLELAQAGSAANLERIVRGWKALDRKSEVTAEQIRHRSRRFSAFVDVDGMVVVRGRLDPEVGAMLMRAVEAASDALFREEDSTIDEPNTELQEVTPEQRRADAVGLIAERALAAGFGGRAGRGAGSGLGNGRAAGSGSDGAREPASEATISGSRAERYQVMLHVDESTLSEDAEPGQSELEDGTRVSAEPSGKMVKGAMRSGKLTRETAERSRGATSRRLSCDCGVVKIGHGPDGEVTGAGRRTRTVPPALRRALEARDRGCRFPGCGLRFTEAHHIKHWADGGETNLRNLALLCRRHHRAVHEGRVRICMDVRGQVAFFTPKGRALFDAPPQRGIWAPETGAGATSEVRPRPAPELISRQPHRTGQPHVTRPAHLSGAAKWQRDRDIPYAVEARVWEALDSG